MEEDLISRISTFLKENYYSELNSLALTDSNSIYIDFKKLQDFDIFISEKLLLEPEATIKKFEEVVRSIDLPIDPERIEKIRVRFFNLPESSEVRIRNLRERHLRKFIVVDGVVKRASEVRPEIYLTTFECNKCGFKITIEQNERTIKKPDLCPLCKKSSFSLVDKKLRDARWIVIEEPFEIRAGETTSEVFVYLTEDLVNEKNRIKTDPGNRIKVFGILKESPRRLINKYGKEMEIYIEANNFESVETQWEDIEITEEDEKKIIELASSPTIYEDLVQSIAPSIFGYDELKLALILQMFGGQERITPDKARIRGEINILIIGEPATAKSQFLKIVSQIMPRARYVSGKAATAAGLIATVTRDEEFLGGWVLEAGAVVLANRSIACLDEFEKIDKSDMIALHEVMEQGSCSIAKASIVATLPAKTSILAAANPKYGRFDEYKPISEQIDVPPTIMTRFDLKFALKDIVDKEKDKKMLEYVEKVRYFQEEMGKPKIDNELLRKYIAYARSKCKPRLTPEAASKLNEFYLKLREASSGGVVSITMRQYESLVRLAEASAKIQLSEFVRSEDAERAINLMLYTLKQFGYDFSTGTIDIDKAEGQKITHEHRSKMKIIEDVIKELEEKYGETIPYKELIEVAQSKGVSDAESIIRKMQEIGELFFPKPDKVQRIKKVFG